MDFIYRQPDKEDIYLVSRTKETDQEPVAALPYELPLMRNHDGKALIKHEELSRLLRDQRRHFITCFDATERALNFI